MLNQHGRIGAYKECLELRNFIKNFGAKGEWIKVAEKFVDYFLADYTWDEMPKEQRQTFVERLPPNFHEWDAVLNEKTTIKDLKLIAAKTLLVSGSNTRRIFKEIFEILSVACPHWSFTELVEVGHMAPLTHPDQINRVIIKFLEETI